MPATVQEKGASAVMPDDVAPREPLRAEWISATELIAITGVTYRRVDYWTRENVIVAIQPARGSGTRRRFEVGEALVVAAILDVESALDAALPMSTLRRIAHAVRSPGGSWLRITEDTARRVPFPIYDRAVYFPLRLGFDR